MAREITVNKEYHNCDCKAECCIETHTKYQCVSCEMCLYHKKEG